MSEKLTPDELATQFLAMGPEDFGKFWLSVFFEWDQEDGDVEAQWFYSGKKIGQNALTTISAMHSAVASGKKSAAREAGQ